MIVLPVRRTAIALGSLSALLFFSLSQLACHSLTPAPIESPLEPLRSLAARVPDQADLAAARLAAAALSSARPQLDAAMIELEAALPEDSSSKLLPLAIDLVNTTLDDPRAYREASRQLLRRGGLDPALEERLRRSVEDDPLRLARRRVRDSRHTLFARAFNTVSEPLGKSLLTGVTTAPYRLALSAAHWLAGLWEAEPLSLQRRQALVHRRRFLAAFPDAPEAERVARLVAQAEHKFERTQCNRLVDRAKRALSAAQPRRAEALARRALFYKPGDRAALRLVEKAEERVVRQRELSWRSSRASEAPPVDLTGTPSQTQQVRRLAEALLVTPSEIAPAARALAASVASRKSADADRESRGMHDLNDEIEFALVLAQLEAGYERESWAHLRTLARRSVRRSNMARHSAALATSPWQNPHRTFTNLRRKARRRSLAWHVLGGWSAGPRYHAMPAALAYLIDAPQIAQTIVTSPLRALFSIATPKPDFERPAALLAYRYLARNPDGRHTRQLVAWLFDYEKGRGNWPAALRLSDLRPGFDEVERKELVEKAASLGLEAADRARRRDVRGSILRDVVREFPESEAGRQAGELARAEVISASAQRIRMTRGFLEENRAVVGPEGLGLRAALLDGRARNGELHPQGITFLGGRTLEFHFMNESGDEDDEPVRIRREVSAERLARCVALLEETVIRNARLDPDDELGADAQRDFFFERARLGLTGVPDLRASAESTYVFEGLRERYGMVRGRESLLPFDLVLQGSFYDLSLGAFPRWREPKETPDAFIYR
ncbi:MAG: hypothetical protein V3T33_07615 [Myxococcota bacterium]